MQTLLLGVMGLDPIFGFNMASFMTAIWYGRLAAALRKAEVAWQDHYISVSRASSMIGGGRN